MLQHALAVLNLAPAQPTRIGTIQPGRMALETHLVEPRQARLICRGAATQCETDDHEDDDNNRA
jgi:hypothetical protein